MKLSDFVAGKVYENALQAKGLAYLFRHCVPDGTAVSDRDARIGIGNILEEVADNGRRLNCLLEENSRSLDREIEVNWRQPDPIVQVERQCERSTDHLSPTKGDAQ
jgi:hypothetical protein